VTRDKIPEKFYFFTGPAFFLRMKPAHPADFQYDRTGVVNAGSFRPKKIDPDETFEGYIF